MIEFNTPAIARRCSPQRIEAIKLSGRLKALMGRRRSCKSDVFPPRLLPSKASYVSVISLNAPVTVHEYNCCGPLIEDVGLSQYA
jgi:hypothetical protein